MAGIVPYYPSSTRDLIVAQMVATCIFSGALDQLQGRRSEAWPRAREVGEVSPAAKHDVATEPGADDLRDLRSQRFRWAPSMYDIYPPTPAPERGRRTGRVLRMRLLSSSPSSAPLLMGHGYDEDPYLFHIRFKSPVRANWRCRGA